MKKVSDNVALRATHVCASIQCSVFFARCPCCRVIAHGALNEDASPGPGLIRTPCCLARRVGPRCTSTLRLVIDRGTTKQCETMAGRRLPARGACSEADE